MFSEKHPAWTHALLAFSTAIILLLLQTTSLQAQPQLFEVGLKIDPSVDAKDSEGRAIQQTRDGGFVTIANWYGLEGGQFTKFDALGVVLEQEYYFEDPGMDPWSIHQTNVGDIGYVFVGANTRHKRAIMIKVDDAGKILWEKRMSTATDSEARCVEVLNNGNYVMVGFEQDASNPSIENMLLICYDPSGMMLWSYTLNTPGFSTCDRAKMRGYSIREIGSANEFVVTGSVDVSCPPDAAVQGVTLMHFTYSTTAPFVTLNWAKVYDDSDFETRGMDVRQTSDDGFLISGTATTIAQPARTDGVVIRTDQLGNRYWTQVIGDTDHDESFYAVEESASGGVFAVGQYKDATADHTRILTMQFDVGGTLIKAAHFEAPQWNFESNQGAFDMEKTAAGGYAIVGYKDNVGANTTDPHTYIMHVDEQLCFNNTLCIFEQDDEVTKQTKLGQSPLVLGPLLGGPDETFVDYIELDIKIAEVHECPHEPIHQPLFQYHFDDKYDRGLAGVAFEGTVGGGGLIVPQYALTGIASYKSDLSSQDMPILVHGEDGSIISNQYVRFTIPNTSKYYHAEGHDIQRTSDNGFALAGRLVNSLGSGNTEDNAVITRVEGTNPDWAVSIGERLADHDELFKEVRPIPNLSSSDGNGYVAAGYATNGGTQRQALVTYVNQSGAVQFAKTYSVLDRAYTEAQSVHPVDADGDGLADNGFIVVGSSKELGSNPGQNGFADRDVFVMRLDNLGAVQWAFSYSLGDCWATSIVPTDDDSDGFNDDGFILCGTNKNSINRDAIVIKIDELGMVEWKRTYHRSSNDQAMGIVQRDDDSFAFTGVTYYNDIISGIDYEEQVYIAELLVNGDVHKSQAAPGFELPVVNAGQEDCANDIDVLEDGSLFITGSNCSFSEWNKGDMYSTKIGIENSCRMQELSDEKVTDPTLLSFTHSVVSGSGQTLQVTDVQALPGWVHTESPLTLVHGYDEFRICYFGELCFPQGGTLVTSASEHEHLQHEGHEALELSPNPVSANSLLTVNIDRRDVNVSLGANIQVFDIAGNKLLEAPVTSAQSEQLIPIGDWASGVYIMTLQLPNGKSSSVKFMVQ